MEKDEETSLTEAVGCTIEDGQEAKPKILDYDEGQLSDGPANPAAWMEDRLCM